MKYYDDKMLQTELKLNRTRNKDYSFLADKGGLKQAPERILTYLEIYLWGLWYGI